LHAHGAAAAVESLQKAQQVQANDLNVRQAQRSHQQRHEKVDPARLSHFVFPVGVDVALESTRAVADKAPACCLRSCSKNARRRRHADWITIRATRSEASDVAAA
jgi:hypothetical protein